MDFGMPTLIELDSIEKCAALAHELGLRFVEINTSFPQYQLDVLDIEELIRIKEKYGIYYTVHADESFDACNVNGKIAKVYVQDMLNTVELAKILDIPSINMHLLRGIFVTLPDRRTYIYGENETLYLERLRSLRDRVQAAVGEADIHINVENTDGYDCPFLVHGLDTLLESPVFGMTYDVGHNNAIGMRDNAVILPREDRLRHFHLHDGVGTRVHLALGDGDMDIESFLSLAEKHSCRVVIETKTVEALKKSVGYLREKNKGCRPE